MKRRLAIFFATYLALALPFALSKPLFLLLTPNGGVPTVLSDLAGCMLHGLPLDLSVAAYLMALPALLLIASVWTDGKWLRLAARVYFAVAGLTTAACLTLNIALYPHWQFPLDATPLFYFTSSPVDALASVSLWEVAVGLIVTLLLAGGLAWCWDRCFALRRLSVSTRRVTQTLVLVLLAAAFFVPARGGITVSTMNTGQVYFSDTPRLNHAAVNPVFSLLESLSKQSDFASQFRFLDETERRAVFDSLMKSGATPADSTLIRSGSRPDIILLVLESFSSHLMSTLGGESDAAVCLDTIARQGLLFTNFYASSFRTDRGLVPILSGFPAQPTTSVMKYPAKTAHLPGIAATLRQAGYSTTYYYGGDADFCNMRSYLHNTGFSRIVCDTDFPVSERLSKWGVHDHILFDKVESELTTTSQQPRFCVVQTSSSHEPFEVPYKRKANVRLNAFCYTDSVVGHFVSTLQASPRWENTLLVIVPDHMGAYPENTPDTSPDRYRIPLILTGGALTRRGTVDTLADQTDIAATLLGALGLPATDFPFSKDIFSPDTPRRAFFSTPNVFGMVDAHGMHITDIATLKTVMSQGPAPQQTARHARAYLQTLYDTLATLGETRQRR